MQSYSDFEEILLAFTAAGVRNLIVGAFAVAAHARPRATGDIGVPPIRVDILTSIDGVYLMKHGRIAWLERSERYPFKSSAAPI